MLYEVITESAGLTLIADNYAIVPVVANLLVPHWTPLALREPGWKSKCTHFNGSARTRCERLMDPNWERKDCQRTSILHEETAKILEKFRLQYEHAVDTSVPSHIMDPFCSSHPGFCATSKAPFDWHSETDAHNVHLRRNNFV